MDLEVGDVIIYECPRHRWTLNHATIKSDYRGLPSALFVCRASPQGGCSWQWSDLLHFSDPAHVRSGRPILLKKHEGPGEPEGYDGNWSPKTQEPEEPEPTVTTFDDFKPDS